MSEEELSSYLSSFTMDGRDLKTTDGLINISRYERIKILTAIKTKEKCKNSIRLMAAEWQAHNIANVLFNNPADINIDKVDDRFWVKLPTYILYILGEIWEKELNH